MSEQPVEYKAEHVQAQGSLTRGGFQPVRLCASPEELERAVPSLSTPSPFATQVGGGHYKQFKIQPTEFIMANNIGFCEGNVIKYLCRYATKNGKEDLLKAKHYIDMILATKYPG